MGVRQPLGTRIVGSVWRPLQFCREIVAGLPRYEGRTGRRRQSSPKLIVLNTALMSAYSGYTFSDGRADRTFWGRLVETAVGAHLYNMAWPATRIYYWRDRDTEVDFVLEQGRRLLAVEVESNDRGTNRSGLDRFQARFAGHGSVIVGGDRVPVAEFLRWPAAHWFEETT